MSREEGNRLNKIIKNPLVELIKQKTKERNEVDEALKSMSESFSKCAEIEARKDNEEAYRHFVMSHIESVILNSYKTQKSYYHARCLEKTPLEDQCPKASFLLRRLTNTCALTCHLM